MNKPAEQFGPPEHPLMKEFPLWLSSSTRLAMMQLCLEAESAPADQTIFAQKLMRCIEAFGAKYPKGLQALFEGETLGGTGKQERMKKRAADKVTELPNAKERDNRRWELWPSAGEHTFVVGMLAEILAIKMQLPADRVEKVALAAMLHDWHKKQEILAVWDAEDALIDSYGEQYAETHTEEAKRAIRSAFDMAKARDEAELREMKIDPEVIELTGANRIKDAQGPQTPESKILIYLDQSVNGVVPTGMQERIQRTVEKNPIYLLYEESFRDEFGGQTFYEYLQSNSKELQKELASAIGYGGDPSALYEHVRALFIEEVQKY